MPKNLLQLIILNVYVSEILDFMRGHCCIVTGFRHDHVHKSDHAKTLVLLVSIEVHLQINMHVKYEHFARCRLFISLNC